MAISATESISSKVCFTAIRVEGWESHTNPVNFDLKTYVFWADEVDASDEGSKRKQNIQREANM